MSVHFETLTRVFRCYAPGESFAAGAEPIAVGVVNRRDSGEVEVMATMGQLNRADLRDIVAGLGAEGVTRILIKRRRGHRVPLGRLVSSGDRFDIYEVLPAELEARA
ncbi:hypothetical protein [Denitromonas halophila]|uniref:Uncharacterized protein n=1 Tax=Denitromonas halophila TaxID=1629404 RepID=A0A557QXB0_9RHOO|nr:hypothetical protein [Denitromonas halophila]TVO57547.1 hypothetical protein FHP91_07675 [Denitromonas halophila]